MSTSKLGPLPEFGRKKGGLTASVREDSTYQSQLDDALGSNKRDDRPKSRDPQARTKKKVGVDIEAGNTVEAVDLGNDDSNFYGKLADLANESFEESEDENLAVTEEDTKVLASSVDIDDMDAGLFSSFSQNQKKKTSHSRAKPSRLQSGRTGEPQTGADKSEQSQGLQKRSPFSPLEDEEFHREVRKAETLGAPQQPPARKLSQTELEPSAPRGGQKSKTTELDDDLLDLLSDGNAEDPAPKKRTKPRIQLRTGRAKTEGGAATDTSHRLQSDGKPITSGERMTENEKVDASPSTDGRREATTSERDSIPDRPRTGHGRAMTGDMTAGSEAEIRAVATGASEGAGGDSGPNVLKLDSPMHQSVPSRKPRGSVDVDFDGDDILSGMGLEDEEPALKSSAGGLVGASRVRRGSKLDELLGTAPKKPFKTEKLGAKGDKSKTGGSTTASGLNISSSTGEEDGYQFGGYVPSVASGEVHVGKPTGLPPGRKRHSSDGDPLSLTSRPTSAPAKKSVRFADTVETSDRPSSSPSVSEVAKTPLKGSRKHSGPKEGEGGLRKPPLPRKSEAEREAKMSTEKSSGGSESTDESTQRDDSQSDLKPRSGEELIGGDGLLPWDESTTKHSTRGRGRSSSTQKSSSAAKLFAEREEEQTLVPPSSEASTVVEHPPETAAAVKTPSTSEKFEYPAFPWSQGGGRNKPVLTDKEYRGISQSSPPSLQSSFAKRPDLPLARRQSDGGPEISLQGGQLALFQEQLVQQQRQVQEQMLQMQALGGQLQSREARGARGSLSSVEEEGLRSGLKAAQERVRELEGDLGEKTEQQRRLLEVQEQLQSSVEAQEKAEEQCKTLRERNSELESALQKSQLESTSAIDELKLKLHRLELEQGQLSQSLDGTQTRHTEEIEAIQKSNEARLQAMEESYRRREARWREEAESEASRFQERLQQAEREKSDAVLSLRKKLDAAEVARGNEIARLQEVHRTSVEDLKAEHEVERQHLHSLHQQEIAALKTAHSHTHTLSALTRQVEASTRGVSQLQARVDHAHSQGMEDREYSTRAQEEHLKLLEGRLSKQQLENEQERERLQTLTAKMEAHITQQARQIEQERWQLQQEVGRLRAKQIAFEEERAASLKKLEEEKEQLQQAKERFLVEQREVLAQCYEERRSLASERAELSLLQKRALEREQRESKKSIQTEAEVESALSHLREEGARVEAEGARVREEGERVMRERQALERDRDRMEAFGAEIQQRAQEIEEMCQSAVRVREQGEQALCEAQRLQLQSLERSRALEAEMAVLREREKQFANEQLALAQERRELQHRSILRSTLDCQSQAESLTLQPKEESSSKPHLPMSSSLPLPPLHTYPVAPSTASGLPGRAYSPVHMHHSVRSSLSLLQHTSSLRQMTLEAQKDEEDLEEECKFLESLRTFSDLHGSVVTT